MPWTDESGPRHRGRPDTTKPQPQRNAHAQLLPMARALLLPRSGRRSLDAAVVLKCCYCRRSHLHRGFDLNGAVRESGCSPRREYVLVVRL